MGASLLDQSNKIRDILKWVFLVLALGWSIFLIINGIIPGGESKAQSDSVAHVVEDAINTVSPGTINPSNFDSFAFTIRKLLGHFLAFTLDGILISICVFFFLINQKWYKFYFPMLIAFSAGFVVAGISELIQLFTAGRSGQWSDIFIDLGGYVLGMVIIFLILFLTKNLDPRYQTDSIKFKKIA